MSSVSSSTSVKGAAAMLDLQLNSLFKQMHTDYNKFGSIASPCNASPLKSTTAYSYSNSVGSLSTINVCETLSRADVQFSAQRKRTLSNRTIVEGSNSSLNPSVTDIKSSNTTATSRTSMTNNNHSVKKLPIKSAGSISLDKFTTSEQLSAFYGSNVGSMNPQEVQVEIIGSHTDPSSSRALDFKQTFSLTNVVASQCSTGQLPYSVTVNSCSKRLLTGETKTRDPSINQIFRNFFSSKKIAGLNISTRVLVNTGALTSKLRTLIRASGYTGRIEINYKFNSSAIKIESPKIQRGLSSIFGGRKSSKVTVDVEFAVSGEGVFDEWVKQHSQELTSLVNRKND